MPFVQFPDKARRWKTLLPITLALGAGVGLGSLQPLWGQTISPTPIPSATWTSSPTVTAIPTETPADAVWTQHNNGQRTGVYDHEPTLNPTTVSTASPHPFHRIATFPVSDSIYAQPLYVPRVDLGGRTGVKNLLLIATTDCQVYAFDADQDKAVTLWHTTVIPPGTSGQPDETPTNAQDFKCLAYSGAIQSPDFVTGDMGNFDKNIGGDGLIGILGTPVIDRGRGVLYVVSRTTLQGGNGVEGDYYQRLWALDIRTGKPMAWPHNPFLIPVSPEKPDGFGEFRPMWQNQRAALALSPLQGNPGQCRVYATWAGQCDTDLYHGWVMAFDCGSGGISLVARFNDTPDSNLKGDGGGIWQAGQGPALDGQGNLYVMSGNGDFNIFQHGGRDYGNSFIKLSPKLEAVDYFTPSNQVLLDQTDYDMGSAGPVLISPGPGGEDLVLGAGKEARYYLLRASQMGHYDCSGNGAAYQQAFVTIGALNSDYATAGESPQEGNLCVTNHIHGGSICWTTVEEGNSRPVTDREVFVMAENDVVRGYRLTEDCKLPLESTPVSYTRPVVAVVPRLLVGASGRPAAIIPSFVPFVIAGEENQKANPKKGEGVFPVAQPSEMGYYNDADSNDPRNRNSIGMPGGMLSLSSDGKDPRTGILWVSYPDEDSYIPHVPGRGDPHGILVAYKAFMDEKKDEPTTIFGEKEILLEELWCSGDVPNNNKNWVGSYAKYVPPTVANGRVYMALSKDTSTGAKGGVAVYGLDRK